MTNLHGDMHACRSKMR